MPSKIHSHKIMEERSITFLYLNQFVATKRNCMFKAMQLAQPAAKEQDIHILVMTSVI